MTDTRRKAVTFRETVAQRAERGRRPRSAQAGRTPENPAAPLNAHARRAAQLALALTFNRRATHVERRSGGATRTIAETGRNRVLCIGFSLKNGFAPKRERQKPSSRKTAMRSGPANPCARRDPCRFTALSLPSRHRNEPGRPARARPYQLAEPRRRRKRAWQSLLLACSQGARPESVSAGSHRPGLTKDDPLPVKPGGNRKVRRRPGNPAVAAQNPSAPFPG